MTHKEYIGMYRLANSVDGTKLHQQYYGQFVTDVVRDYVKRTIGLSAILKSTDENFNDIHLMVWDKMKGENLTIYKLMKEIGEDYLTLAGQVATLKEAARQVKEEERFDHE